MKFELENGQTIDTAAMGPEERHILQKLLAWQSLVDSVAGFREKVTQALAAGWNGSGPVGLSPGLSRVIREMERQVAKRLSANRTP